MELTLRGKQPYEAKGYRRISEELIISCFCFWVVMAMASLWMPPLSSQLASMSICLPHRKCAGGVLRRNVADRRGGCPGFAGCSSFCDGCGRGAFNGGKR